MYVKLKTQADMVMLRIEEADTKEKHIPRIPTSSVVRS